ncbi:uncharacterized protein LOC113514709 [Galleria mellonella]|uniref:Uncharacterized protein LOC113514709 n=1 Tax=Galleria mellonella TaxID=7137 RepID=A0A6J1WJZ6_GALME|nr:uncharacterized protein LOC113514709 [Galleria mellonella]
MAIERLITLTLAVVAAAALAASMPTKKEPGKLDLSDAINKTVCPIKIEINDDPKRIPRRIKEMKCRDDPNVWCSKNHIPSNECCQHQHAAVHMQCVEIQDWVQVYYPETDDTQTSRVSVGCMCVMQQGEMAQDSQPS